MTTENVVIVGAGPAGLTAGLLLARSGVGVRVLEADPERVGGLARTLEHRGYRFDVGPHRFFSKSREVERLWSEILGDDFLECDRLTRIYYRGRFFHYPLRPVEALWKLGPIRSAACMLSYLKARAFPVKDPKTFEDWVTNRFGARLYRTFFKTYTEKVWGMSCREISADWAAQRIKGFSLGAAIKGALARRPSKGGEVHRTIVDSFRYPRKGAGMMWQAFADEIERLGGEVLLGHRVERLEPQPEGRWRVVSVNGSGKEHAHEADHVVSSAPLSALASLLEEDLAERAREACEALRYRDYLAVVLVARDRGTVPDHWIYVHEPSVRVGRIVNYQRFSPDMAPEPGRTALQMEYFCFEGDELWEASDDDLVALATEELGRTGLVSPEDVEEGLVLRQPKAYPVYDGSHAGHVQQVREELERSFPTLHQVGRNGMHVYNNQDHSMIAAMLTVRRILEREDSPDPWLINQDGEYQESGTAGSEELPTVVQVPERVG